MRKTKLEHFASQDLTECRKATKEEANPFVSTV